jgi:hypothetical protein
LIKPLREVGLGRLLEDFSRGETMSKYLIQASYPKDAPGGGGLRIGGGFNADPL